jgi:hypothetical protein
MTYIITKKMSNFTLKLKLMESTVARQFVMLSLHPEKGRIIIYQTQFRYCLIGAYFMDLYNRGEVSLTNKRLSHSFRKNGEPLHDQIAERIERSSRPKRFSYWISRLSSKSRLIFRENIASLVSAGILRHEKRYFLNIIPYNRYFFNDQRARNEIIEGLRGVLLHGRQATDVQMMLIGLIKASDAHSILAREKGEKGTLRKKCSELMKKDELSSEVDKVIREVRAAITSAVIISTATSSGAH